MQSVLTVGLMTDEAFTQLWAAALSRIGTACRTSLGPSQGGLRLRAGFRLTERHPGNNCPRSGWGQRASRQSGRDTAGLFEKQEALVVFSRRHPRQIMVLNLMPDHQFRNLEFLSQFFHLFLAKAFAGDSLPEGIRRRKELRRESPIPLLMFGSAERHERRLDGCQLVRQRPAKNEPLLFLAQSGRKAKHRRPQRRRR